MEKRRAVGALCHLERAREEKPLLLLEMSTCSKTLLSEQSRLANSVAWSTDNGCRALLQKKRFELHTLMQQLWIIFINFLPDLPPIGEFAAVLPVPEFENDDELEEINQWETVEKDELCSFTMEKYTTALASSLPNSQDLVFSVSRLKTTMNCGAATLLVNHREANLPAAFLTLKNNFLGGLASFVQGSMR